MVGKGTFEDPRRPMFAPAPGRKEQQQGEGITAFSFVMSDDGRFALAEFVARDRAALREILDSKLPDVRVFQKGHAKRDDIERELRKHRKNFSLNELRTVTQ